MERFALAVNPDIRYQVMVLTVNPDDHNFRARVEIRYLNEPQLWYISVFDTSTGESFCRYVPLIASYNMKNDLFSPFRHKRIGSFYCVPLIATPSSTNPGLNNLGEFELIWGDTDDS